MGQTIVQLPQVRQRCGHIVPTRIVPDCASSSSCRSSERIWRPMVAAVCATTNSAAVDFALAPPRGAARSSIVTSASVAGLQQEFVAAVAEDLGQGEIVAGLGLRPGVHRCAEAGAAGLAAIHRDDEDVLAARPVVRIDVGPPETRGPGWRSRAARRSARRGRRSVQRVRARRLTRTPVPVMLRAPQAQQRRVQERFQACGPTA